LAICALGRFTADYASLSLILDFVQTQLRGPESPHGMRNAHEIVHKTLGWHAFMHGATPCLRANAREIPQMRGFARK
jgi:hypothetical protein